MVTTADDTKHEYFRLEYMVGKNWGWKKLPTELTDFLSQGIVK